MLIPILLAIGGFITWSVIQGVRSQAARSPQRRQFFLLGAPIALLVGPLIALWLPEHVDFNRESPAGLFYVYLPCFLIGGGLFFGAIGALIGALAAPRDRPPE